jgi:zinc protease
MIGQLPGGPPPEPLPVPVPVPVERRSEPRILRSGFVVWVLGFLYCASIVSAQFQGINWPLEGPPKPLAPRTMNFPAYEVRTLANGLRVIAVAQTEQPAVTMRLLVGAGAAQDASGKSGTSRLVASLLDQGTASRSAEQIADQIDSIGGSLGTGSGTDLSNVYAVVMKDSFAVAMDLVHDVVRNPAFAIEEIDRQKQQAISSLQVNAGDPDYVASVLFDRLVYGFHPYGVTNSPQSLAAITRADLQAFHRRHYVPNNMILAIVGDVTSAEAFATAEKVFGGWPRGPLTATPPIEPPPPTRRIVVVDKPDAVQTEIRVGQLAIPRKHPQYDTWDLAVKILGGEGANRLQQVLRSERGLTYGASADTQAMKQAGDFVAETDTRTETTGQALRLMIDEFSRLSRQRVGERELANAQAYLAGSFPLTLETPNDLATQLLNQVFYELPVEEIRTYRERVQAITPDDIQGVAKQYIRPDRLSIVLVGNAKEFVNQLRAQAFNDFEVIPIEQLDLASATLTRDRARVEPFEPFGTFASFGSFRSFGPFSFGSFGGHGASRVAYASTQANPKTTNPPNVPNDKNGPNVPNVPNVSNVSNDANALLARVVAARGGLEALRNVRTVIAESVSTMQLQQGALPIVTRASVAYPDKFRNDLKVGPDELVQIYNAGAAWEKTPKGVREAPAAMRDDWADNVRRDMIPLLVAASEGRLQAQLLPEQLRPDGSRVRVLEISGNRVEPVRLFIDDKHLIVGQSFTKPGPNGKPLRNEEVFSDYRVVDGIQVPFQARLVQNGRTVLARTLTSVRFNAPVPETLFARPN